MNKNSIFSPNLGLLSLCMQSYKGSQETAIFKLMSESMIFPDFPSGDIRSTSVSNDPDQTHFYWKLQYINQPPQDMQLAI